MKIFVVVPAYNEKSTITKVISELSRDYENIVVVDDASMDGTSEQLLNKDVTVLQHLINRGQGASLKTGITYALQKGADVIVTFDSDGQHNPDDIKKLIEPIIQNKVEVTLGSRFIEAGLVNNMPGFRKTILKAAIVFTKFTSKLNITDTHNGLRAFTKHAASAIRIKQDRMTHASEILDEIYRNKLSYQEVPVSISYTEYSTTKSGENKNPLAFGRILFKYFIGKLMK